MGLALPPLRQIFTSPCPFKANQNHLSNMDQVWYDGLRRSVTSQHLKSTCHIFCCSDWLLVYTTVSILQVHEAQLHNFTNLRVISQTLQCWTDRNQDSGTALPVFLPQNFPKDVTVPFGCNLRKFVTRQSFSPAWNRTKNHLNLHVCHSTPCDMISCSDWL